MLYSSFIEIKSNIKIRKRHTTDQCSNFLGGIFGNINIVRIKIHTERERQSQHLKIAFSIKEMLNLSHNNSTRLSEIFAALKSTSFLVPQSTVSRSSDIRSIFRSQY